MKKKAILIVDDDQFVLQLLSSALSEDHYDVFKANCVEKAMDTYKRQDIDLIITDIIMPDQDGIALIDFIKKTDQKTPVIAISGGDKECDNADQYIDFALYFADETLKKPFSKSDLLHAVESLINNEYVDLLKYL